MYLEIFISGIRELHDSASKTSAFWLDWHFMKPLKFLKNPQEKLCDKLCGVVTVVGVRFFDKW